MISLNAFRLGFDERDRFAISLGFQNHFDEVLKTLIFMDLKERKT